MKIGSFIPTDISDLALWLDASDSSTITFNGSDASAWADKSGNGKNCVQGTPSRQPTYNATGMNSKGTLIFDGSNTTMENAGLSVTQPNTIIIVASQDVQGSNKKMFDAINASPQLIESGSVSDDIQMYAGSNVSSIASIVTIGDPFVCSAVFNGGSSYLYFNGAYANLGNVGANNLTNYIVGADHSIADFWNGKISEILVFDKALSDAERRRVEDYAITKWGI